MDVHAVFIVLLMLPAAVKMADESKGNAEFSWSQVTLTCPEDGRWFKYYDDKNEIMMNNKNKTYEFKYEDIGKYYCKYGTSEKTYQFYVEGKACDNCFELDALVFLAVIIVDLVGTVIVMMMVFKCTKKKDSAGTTQTPRAPAPAGGRPPPLPASDYERLNPHTRSHDTYSLVNRTG